ncbi:MAG: HtaA domain-containing protein [Pseudomonadota bacterium]
MNFKKLNWGVKASFRAYVEAAEGTITVSDGATRAADGSIVFEALPDGDLSIAADGQASGSQRFQGTVTFEAHGGMLKSTLSALCVEVEGDELVLTVQDAQLEDNRCAIATLVPTEDATDGALTLSAAITIDGMYQIADNYLPGTELDPVQLES